MYRVVALLLSVTGADAGIINANPDPAHRFELPDPSEKFDAIIVGAGGGGLAAGARLCQQGKRPLIIDQASRIGGAWVTYNLTGDHGAVYRVDGSLHVLEKPSPKPYLTDYFSLLMDMGAYDKIKWTDKRSIHRFVLDKEPSQREWIVYTDKEQLIKELLRDWPEHEQSMRDLLSYVEKIVGQVEGIADMTYLKGFKKFLKEIAVMKDFALLKAMFAQSTHDLCKKFNMPDNLTSILTSPAMYCAVPDKILAGILYAEMAGMWFKYGMTYPQGGSGAIAQHHAAYIEAKGGKIVLNTEANEIYTVLEKPKPRVTGVRAHHWDHKTGEVQEISFSSEAVISDVNILKTIELAGEKNFNQGWVKHIYSMNISDSVFMAMVGVKDKAVLNKIKGDPEILLADSLDMNDNFARIRKGELSFMDLTDMGQNDPECCAEGTSVVAMIMPIPMDVFSPAKDVRAKQNERYLQQMMDRAEGYLPGFKAACDMSSLYIVDPYVAQSWMGTPKGTEMGFYPTVQNMNIFTGVPGQDMENMITGSGGMTGLFQVGQFSFPGGGQPTVSQSGQTAAMMIMNGINMPKGRYEV